MVLIALSWIYILFTSINFGCVLNKMLKLKTTDFSVTALLGVFGVTIITSFWAFFGAINIGFHLFLLLANCALAVLFKMQIVSIYRELRFQLRKLTIGLKLILTAITILIIAQCAAAPYIVDNESYYIQTVKWLNEYGLVVGLGNLHYFFAQTSGWHIAQSAFSFSFLYPNFNDLSGFCLLLGNLFAILKLNEYSTNRNLNFLVVGLFPIANVFFCRFIGGPAPDIAIYVLSFIVVFQFLECYKKTDVSDFNLLSVLVLFAVYIKPTSITLGIFPLILLFRNYQHTLWSNYRILITALIIFGLYLGKSLVLTGYALYPFPISFGSWQPDHQIPFQIVEYFTQNQTAAFELSNEQYQNANALDLFLRWLTLPGLHGIFNKVAILLILISPFFIRRFLNNKQYWFVYLAMVLQLAILFAFSPQYRFFFNFILFFGFLCVASFLRKIKFAQSIIYLSTIGAVILLFLPVNLSAVTSNKLAQNSESFSVENIIFPHANSKSVTAFETAEIGNLNYYSPVESSFLWETGNGELPCINQKQIEFFEYYFNVIPQMRSDNLGEGFYSKNTADE